MRRLTILAALALLPGCRMTAARRDAAGPLDPAADRPAELRIDPRAKADVQAAMARSMESDRDGAEAIRLYEEALKLDPSRADARARLAMLHDRRGEFTASAPLFEEALKARPDDAELLCDRGYSLYLQGRGDEAERALRRAIERKPDLARAHNNLGLLLARRGRKDEALDHFARAGGTPSERRSNLAFALALEGRWDEAQAEYRAALAADPGSAVAAAGLARVEGMRDRAALRDGEAQTASYRPTADPTGAAKPH